MNRRLSAMLAASGLSVLLLTGCGDATRRISEIGKEPAFTDPQRSLAQGARPISMPMPTPQTGAPEANSLWRPGARAFFKDQRANTIGDILTVTVDISDQASLENSTNRSRAADEGAGIGALMGLETSALSRLFPADFDPAQMAEFDSNHSATGAGQMQRGESISLKIASVIYDVLPNGNLAILGRQEVRVNHELRQLTVTGIIRPQDINADNTVPSDKIAEARIAYGGRGTLSDVQKPRYGQELFDIVFPF